MTLVSGEKVYQSDLMRITPNSDAQIYGYQGNYILKGLDITSTSNGAAISPGRAIIQGRLFVLETSVNLSFSSAGYIGLMFDLSQDNSVDVDGNVTNHQFTFGFGTAGYFGGNMLDGDILGGVPMWTINSQGAISAQNVYPYKIPQEQNFAFSYPFDDHNHSHTYMSRIGNKIDFQLDAKRIAGGSEVKIGMVPVWATPKQPVVFACFSDDTHGCVNVVIRENRTVNLLSWNISNGKFVTGHVSYTV